MEKSMKNNMNENGLSTMKFSDRLIELRKRKGWSQEDLAEKLEVSRQAVSKWETGESKPETNNLIKMSKLYNLTMEELLEGRDENKVVEAKVVDDADTSVVPKVESTEVKEVPSINIIEVKTEVKKKSFIRKHLRKIIAIVAVLLLIAYFGFSVYKFCILKEINDKFNEYKNVENCYIERKEIVTNNETGTAYILNTRYWYKDKLVKIEEIKTENGITQTFCKYVNLNEEEIYTLYENTKKIIKKNEIDKYEALNDGILPSIIGFNYYKEDIDIIKDSLNILKNIRAEGDKYIKKIKNGKENVKVIYNKDNALTDQLHTLNDKEETKILYNIEIGIVTDEDVKIEFLDLAKYEIIEQ